MAENKNNLEYCPYCNDWHLAEEMQEVRDEKGIMKRICKDCLAIAFSCFEEEALDNQDNVEIPSAPSVENIMTPMQFKEILDSYVIGQKHATKSLAVSIYKQLVKNKFKKLLNNQNEINNMLIVGPTGCGKTYLCQLISRYSGLPLVTVCAADYTANGYVGDSVNDIVLKVYNHCDQDIEKAESAIVFIDEIDKIKINKGASGVDVGGESVQDQLLKIIGGDNITISVGSHTAPKKITINTSNMLFIGAGAFSGITELLPPEKRGKKPKQLGFSKDLENTVEKIDEDLVYLNVTTQEIVKYGFKPEFAGRLPNVITLRNLKVQDLINIMTTAKDNPFDAKVNFFRVIGIDLKIQHDVFEIIAEQAIKNKTGARGLATTLEVALENAIFYGCSTNGIKTCTVTKEMVLDKNAEPLLSYDEDTGDEKK